MYDAQARKVRDTFSIGGAAQSVTQLSYDAAGRLWCSAVRMNLASLPSDACALGTLGPNGADRIARNAYDAAGRLLSVQNAFATALVQTTMTQAYTANGQRDWVEDANGNRSEYTYDGFDRLVRLDFPVAAVGGHAANSNDNEQYGYDPAGNRVSLKLRSGETIAFMYDNLSRETQKDIPGGASADVYSSYDLLGRRLTSRFASSSGQGITYTYDALARVISESENFNNRALSYQYDLAGNRTRVTYPDANYFAYTYDVLNRMSAANENGAAALATYSYDLLSRRTGVTRAGGPSTSYSYNSTSRNWSMTQDLSGTADDLTLAFTLSPAPQVLSRDVSNSAYSFAPPALNQSYTRNGLNQYTQVGGATYTNDLRGNLTSDGSRTLTYDLENRLLSVSGSASGTLSYDPLGRLRTYATGGVTTTFLYSGDQLVAEYNGATLLRRYAHGAGIDEPIVRYEGANLAVRRYLIADNQGSIIAESGATTTRYTYGPYGEPNTWTGSRFRYTGQIALPEIQLYHYKARVYCPECGRFLQTDPVGYEDDLNLYMYVSNDPLNLVDPTGREGESIQQVANAFRRMFSFSEEPRTQPQSVGGALAPVADPTLNATVQAGVQVSGSAATYTGQLEVGVAASTQGEVGAYATTSTGRTSDVLPTAGAAASLTVTNASSLADLRGSSATTSAGGVISMGQMTTTAPDGSLITGTSIALGASVSIEPDVPAVTHTEDYTRMGILNERQ